MQTFPPPIKASVYYTDQGTPYLKTPGVALIAATQTDLSSTADFLSGFSKRDFTQYLQDEIEIPDAERLVKFAGQLCYLSLDEKRTVNADAARYFQNIKSSGHGSVTEHANFSFLIYGCARSFTHELVRHRSGHAFSQVSQRYVDGDVLRFVERPEYQNHPELHQRFMNWIDLSAEEYHIRGNLLLKEQRAGGQILSAESKRDLRKKVQQAARSCLPNETEAPIVVTANVRALRHVIEMRADSPADIEIRKIAGYMYSLVLQMTEHLFSDYVVNELPDGVPGLKTPYKKI